MLGIVVSTLYRRLARLGLSTITVPSAIGGMRAFVAESDLAQLQTALVPRQRAHPTPT